jgi:hypothetical protein
MREWGGVTIWVVGSIEGILYLESVWVREIYGDLIDRHGQAEKKIAKK